MGRKFENTEDTGLFQSDQSFGYTYGIGNILSQSGPTKGNLGFQSKYYDQESGLNYFYHRYYDSNIGRFITEDPMGLSSGINLLSFVKNNSKQNRSFWIVLYL